MEANYYSVVYINNADLCNYPNDINIKDCNEKRIIDGREYTYTKKFEKDSNLVAYALRCIFGSIIYIPAKGLELLLDRKFEWLPLLFIRKELYLVMSEQHNDVLHVDAPATIVPANRANVKPEKYFIQVLNQGCYEIDGKKIQVPPADKPNKIERAQDVSLEDAVASLRAELPDDSKLLAKTAPKCEFVDLSTEHAINVRNGMNKIALNFANQDHAGGGPGYHKDPITGEFVYDCPSARAQEESICQRANLMASLAQEKHVLVKDGGNSKMVRSYYTDENGNRKGFDSRTTAFVSDNHLFAVQHNNQFYQSEYLDAPQPIAFITSAAEYYGSNGVIDCSIGSEVYLDAKQRIETHLYASAWKALEMKKEASDKPVELILGAFGCGAFVPKDLESANAYRKMIANLYMDLLPNFDGFFDQITFAVPTFGGKVDEDPEKMSPAVLNYQLFKAVFDERLSVKK